MIEWTDYSITRCNMLRKKKRITQQSGRFRVAWMQKRETCKILAATPGESWIVEEGGATVSTSVPTHHSHWKDIFPLHDKKIRTGPHLSQKKLRQQTQRQPQTPAHHRLRTRERPPILIWSFKNTKPICNTRTKTRWKPCYLTVASIC